MEKIIFAPEAEVVRFPSQDIVTTSGRPEGALPDDLWTEE